MTSATHQTLTVNAADIKVGDHLIARNTNVTRLARGLGSDVVVYTDSSAHPLQFFTDTTVAIARPRVDALYVWPPVA